MLKRVFTSMGAILSGQALTFLGNLLLVPLFLSHWSTTTYGEWMALSAVIAYLNAADLGVNAAAGNKMVAAYARGDLRTFQSVQGSAIAFYVVLAGAVTVLCGVACLTLPIGAWRGIKSISAAAAAWIAWILASRTVWQMPIAQLASVYRSTGNLAATQWIVNGQAVLLIAVTALVVMRGGSVVQVAACSVLPSACAACGAWCLLRCEHRELIPSLRRGTRSEFLDLIRPSLLFGVMILAIAVSVQGPVVAVSAILGGSAVALLVTTRSLTFLLRQGLGMVTAAVWPELTRLDASGSESALRAGHRLMVIGSVVMSCAFAGALWWEGAEVFQVWTRGRILPDSTLMRAFLASLILQTPWVASAAFTTASNRHRNLAWCWIGASAMNMTGCVLLLGKVGLLAVPLSAMLGESAMCYHFVVRDTCRALGEQYGRFARRLWPGVLLIATAALAMGCLGHKVAAGPALLRWLETGTLTTIAAACTGWVVLGIADRRAVTAHLGRRFPALHWRIA